MKNIYKGIFTLMGEISQIDCAICLVKLEKKWIQLENCAHIFHSNCIKEWASKNNSCPLCRAVIKNEQKPKNISSYYNLIEVYPILDYPLDHPSEYPDSEEDSSYSDEEKSIDYGDASDFEEECLYLENINAVSNFRFRISDNLVVSIL